MVGVVIASHNKWFESGSNAPGTAYEAGSILNRAIFGEHDTGSDRTLAACLIHASRARNPASAGE